MILVTRPGPAGLHLTQQLRARDRSAHWWPAFDILPPADPARLQAVAQAIDAYDLVVFVSPLAVQGFAAALGAAAAWPATTVLAGVGAATLQAARQLPGAQAARGLAPGASAAEGGSEALWPAVAALRPLPRRALIVRAQAGRDWLAQRLAQAGVAVEEVEAYQRHEHRPAPQDWAALRAARAQGQQLAVLFSSSEAVALLGPALRADPELLPWVDGGVALAVHPRIEQALRAAGWRDVRGCAASVESIAAALAGQGAVPAGARPGTGIS